jgi:hypothetical protein
VPKSALVHLRITAYDYAAALHSGNQCQPFVKAATGPAIFGMLGIFMIDELGGRLDGPR